MVKRVTTCYNCGRTGQGPCNCETNSCRDCFHFKDALERGWIIRWSKDLDGLWFKCPSDGVWHWKNKRGTCEWYTESQEEITISSTHRRLEVV